MSKSILIVEDQSDAREMIAVFLQLEGYNVFTAEDGQVGFNLAQKQPPDLIITDIMMPNLDGIEMTKLLRREPRLNKVPIIVMTAYGDGKTLMAINAGANEAMRKPLNFDKLREVTAQLLNAT